jgi:N-ethylmaleimide reductase
MIEHRKPENSSDYIAILITKFLRFFADTFFSKRYGHRAVVLETVAAVPGMVAGMWIHLKCLRNMQHDRGWIKILLDEAENERMHLMTFIEIAKPNWFERALILIAQAVFWHFYFIIYIFFPRTAHRIVGYFEEEAVSSYTSYLEQVEKNPDLNVDAPQIAIDYWKLKSNAKLIDVIKVVRDDEKAHALVNHNLADILDEDNKKKRIKRIELKKEEPKFYPTPQPPITSRYQQFNLGDLIFFNRIVMAPLTRNRATTIGVPTSMMASYYEQRASAGLVIAEATQISQQGQGYFCTPGIYSEAQTEGWKEVVNAVHTRGGKICLQLWHVGRISHNELQPNQGQPVAPSAIRAKAKVSISSGLIDVSEPRSLMAYEIPLIIEEYRQAAVNAKKAGFDMVEIHAANGYLIDQFLRDSSNVRADDYGGSIQNRTRFLLEIVDAVLTIYPPNRIGCRIGPSSEFNDIRDSDPQTLFNYVAEQLGQKSLGYIHVIEGQTGGERNNEIFDYNKIYQIFKKHGGIASMANNGYDKHLAETTSVDLVAFGVPFIANPDLVYRLEHNLPLAVADKTTFYGGAEKGYTDYPFYSKD